MDPAEFEQYFQFIEDMPSTDSYQVFGLNNNIERLYEKNIVFDILKQVSLLNTKRVPLNNPLDIKIKDENDGKVKDIALSLIRSLRHQFDQPPTFQQEPLFVFVKREVSQYNALLSVIKSSLVDLVNAIDGKIQNSEKMEKLWYQILFNYVPTIWLHASYPTCYKSLGDYIANLNDRLNFIEKLVKGIFEIPSYWFPGFFDQVAFLNVLRQRKARQQ
mmetsp:Transcript_7296/g.6469  ORF Transcript_7296/g.6469 Transcript_7296/m.6469 type:complete len:217 (-) Transcript_7296:433-1083(-)